MTITIVATGIEEGETFDDVDALLTAVRRWNDNVGEPVETHLLFAAVLDTVSESEALGVCVDLPVDGWLMAVWGEGAFVHHPECSAGDYCQNGCQL